MSTGNLMAWRHRQFFPIDVCAWNARLVRDYHERLILKSPEETHSLHVCVRCSGHRRGLVVKVQRRCFRAIYCSWFVAHWRQLCTVLFNTTQLPMTCHERTHKTTTPRHHLPAASPGCCLHAAHCATERLEAWGCDSHVLDPCVLCVNAFLVQVLIFLTHSVHSHQKLFVRQRPQRVFSGVSGSRSHAGTHPSLQCWREATLRMTWLTGAQLEERAQGGSKVQGFVNF